jgi:cobalt/nickel transport system permease protein
MASVLTIQALFFADGGLLALGCNIWNLGIYPCFIGYPLIYKPIVQKGMTPKKILVASLLAVFVGLQLGAFSVVLETFLSGRSELPFGTFVLLMQPIHLAIGVVEGFITAGVINYVKAARPEILESIAEMRPLSPEIKVKKTVIAFLVTQSSPADRVMFASSILTVSMAIKVSETELPEHERHCTYSNHTEKTAFLLITPSEGRD